jgi:hypothetical protein
MTKPKAVGGTATVLAACRIMGSTRRTPEMVEKARPIAQRFFALCDEYQVDRYRETGQDVAAASVRLNQTLGFAAEGAEDSAAEN